MTDRRTINPWLIFTLICIPILIGSIDLTSIVVVLPQATLDLLGPKGLNRASQALWAVTAYLLTYTISLTLVGRLSDVLPRKRIFIACIVIFIVGSLWAGFATDLPLTALKALPIWPDADALPLISLILGRIIQAMGAGASVSVGMALVSDIFPPDRRAEPISLIGALDSLGWVIGNLYAGLMLQILPSWRWLFLINAAVAVIALGLTALALRGTKPGRSSGHRFDWRGAFLFSVMLIALTLGIEFLSSPNVAAYVMLGGSMALFGVFIALQLRTRNALIDLKLVRQREVRAALITNLIVGFGLILVVAGVPLIINLRTVFLRGEGLLTGALRAGIMLCSLTFPLVVAVLVGEGRYRRIGIGIPVALGLIIATLGFLGATLWTYTAPGYVIALPLALIGIGLGLTIGPLSMVVVDAAEESARGLASSLVLMTRLLGMTLGTPLAASLTINLANTWASERVAPLAEGFREIARPMLIPPMATDALVLVMLLGAGACLVGLVGFYLPRAWQAIRRRSLGARAILGGTPALIAAIIVVGGLAVLDSAVTPATLSNPIARYLPPNVEFYAGLNIQQAFLQNSKRPLDAVVNLLDSASAPPGGTQPPASRQNPPTASTESPLDNMIKALFRPRTWSAESYHAFCPTELPAWDWPNCFNSGLLSWIGPQAAFALLPRTHAGFDYLFVFQATNRNNAIQFATNLATALGEKEPVELGPNIRMLTANAGTPDERRLAITDAYVMIGTAKAIDYTLNHGNLSLADQPDYQAITRQLPAQDFATFYIRSSNFETDLKPALDSLFRSQIIDSVSRIASRASPFFFTRTQASPTLVGLSMRVDERRLSLSVVANFPFSLQKLNALPVPTRTLGMIPVAASAWAALNLNIAGIAREINIGDALGVLASESTDLRGVMANRLVQGFIMAFGQSLQSVLTHAQGQAVFLLMPGTAGSRGAQPALLLPLGDKENTTAASAVSAIKGQLQTVSLMLLGALQIETRQSTDNTTEIVTVRGKAIEPLLPGGFQYALTPDNVLILAAGDALNTLLPGVRGGGQIQPVTPGLPDQPEQQNKFLYVYVEPSLPNAASSLRLDGEIRRQTLYVNVVLETR